MGLGRILKRELWPAQIDDALFCFGFSVLPAFIGVLSLRSGIRPAIGLTFLAVSLISVTCGVLAWRRIPLALLVASGLWISAGVLLLGLESWFTGLFQLAGAAYLYVRWREEAGASAPEPRAGV